MAKEIFNKHIQDEILFLCITDTEFLKTIRQAFKPEYSPDITGEMIRICYSYFDKYNEAPHDHFHDELIKFLSGTTNDDEIDRYVTYLASVQEMSPPNKDYMIDRVNGFIARREGETMAIEYVTLLEQGEFGKANLKSVEMANLKVGENDFIGGSKRRPVFRYLSEIEPKEIEWLWHNRIPLGMVTLVAGNPKVGKTILTDDIAANTTIGEGWPDDPTKFTEGFVIMAAAEDNVQSVLCPRLLQLHADLSKMITLDGYQIENVNTIKPFTLQDVDILEQTIICHPDTKLVVIDPVTRYLGNVNMNDQSEIVSTISPLNDLAEKYNIAIIVVAHLTKNIAAPAVYRIQGSIGFVSAARVAWQVIQDNDDPDKILFMPLMSNICINPTGLAFRMQGRTDQGTFSLVWDNEEITESIDELTSNSTKNDEQKTSVNQAIEFLGDVLKDGEVEAKEVIRLAEEEGLKSGTLYSASKRLGIKPRREGRRETAKSYWSLPKK